MDRRSPAHLGVAPTAAVSIRQSVGHATVLPVLLSLLLLLAAVPAGAVEATHSTGAAQGTTEVRRLAGPNRYGTAAELSRDGWATAASVVVADGGSAFEALVAGHLAARLDAPLLLSTPPSSGLPAPTETVEELRRLDPSLVYQINDAVLPALDEESVEVQSVRGSSPATLAVAALRAVPGPPGLPTVVASSAVFADALSAASLAPAQLLLTAPDQLHPSSRAYLAEADAAEVHVMGGPAAVTEETVGQITALDLPVSRVAGPNRYATSVVAADVAGATATHLAVASGQDWPDAVALVPWAARRDAAVLLSTKAELPPEVRDALGPPTGSDRPPLATIEDVAVAGGTVAVGNYVDDQITARLAGQPDPGAAAEVRALTMEERAAMTGVSWRPGCPVGLDDLRVVQARRWLFDGTVADGGQLIVHVDVTADVTQVLQRIFEARFPIARMEPVRRYAADDIASMDANNTSAFNCRVVAGTTRWSEHAFGRAVDINPIENPYVGRTVVLPDAGRAYLDRSDVRPGMIIRPGPVVAAFAEVGWCWGADFSSSDDYQHFSESGR
ncbi:cell wall-binding repeat-containing protein [Euzebya tangerina]|uniref:cell wall-binding repeat-containing protein n=1 Tax=Euzebya tangerina TaxID=591198 RepID=UPI000E3217D4|nr:cell wall-binding repeat-containing protein [Euzebya tangerina]